MDKKILTIIGLIGSILVLVGIFTPWASASGGGISVDVSAWDSITESEVIVSGTPTGVTNERETYCVLAFVGGILALVGALGTLAMKGKILPLILLIGGILAIVGAGWGFADIETGTVSYFGVAVTTSYGYGLYLSIVGGILSLAVLLGLKGE